MLVRLDSKWLLSVLSVGNLESFSFSCFFGSDLCDTNFLLIELEDISLLMDSFLSLILIWLNYYYCCYGCCGSLLTLNFLLV